MNQPKDPPLFLAVAAGTIALGLAAAWAVYDWAGDVAAARPALEEPRR